MYLVALEAIASAEAIQRRECRLLKRLESGELGSASVEIAQVLSHEGAHRPALLGRTNARAPIHVVGDRDGDVLHADRLAHKTTASQNHSLRVAGRNGPARPFEGLHAAARNVHAAMTNAMITNAASASGRKATLTG